MITFYYGTMGSNKSTELIRFKANFRRAGKRAIVISPAGANRKDNLVTSRLGLSTKCYGIEELRTQEYDAILCDESQFFEYSDILSIKYIARDRNVDVIFFGLLTTFQGNLFQGSKNIIEISDKLVECTTLCECCGKRKARKNPRYVNGKFTTKGEQIELDNQDNITYKAVCNSCFDKEWKKEFDEKYRSN